VALVPDGSYRTACRACAHGSCGVTVEVRGGRLASIRGDPSDPVSRGYVCAKAIASRELLESPLRIRSPMIRDGDGWREASWDEALDLIARRLSEIRDGYGPGAIAVATGSPRYDIYEWLYTGFAGALGTPSILAVSNFCFVPRAAMGELLVGGHPVVDYDGDPRLVMVWGANPIESNPDEYKYPQLDAALLGGAPSSWSWTPGGRRSRRGPTSGSG